MMKKTPIAMALLTVVALLACQSRVNVLASPIPQSHAMPAEEADTADAATKIAQSFGDWTTMKAGGSLSLRGDRRFSSSMQIRMRRGKSIYISIRPLGIVEVAKLVITGDTLLVVDKIHKQYLCENVKLITNGVPASVSDLQDLFLGRAFLLGQGTLSPAMTGLVELASVDGGLLLRPKTQYKGFGYGFKFNANGKICSAEVTPATATESRASVYAVNYSDVRSTVAGNVAGKISVSTQFKGTDLNLKLDYGTVNWNGNVNISTKLPANYRRIPGERLLNLLGQ